MQQIHERTGGSNKNNLDAALDLAARGLPVFPCRPDDEVIDGDLYKAKSPRTSHGFKDATRDPIVIHRWWARHPFSLIGTPTGDRFVVLDVDLRHDSAQRWWGAHGDRLSATRMHHTRSGGLHLLMKPHPRLTCSSGKIQLGIDTRGRGGYIIHWPAHGHEVINPTVLLPVPDWLLEQLHPPPPLRPAAPARTSKTSPDRSIAGIIRTIAGARAPEPGRF
jgi:putative DNA primase/helicase